MANAALHFAAGLALGMALQSPVIRRAWSQGPSLTRALVRGMALSWGLGLWAIIPSLLHHAGFPESFTGGWWMNLFLLHPLINRWGPHATIIGGAALVGCFAIQYAAILGAILNVRKLKAPLGSGRPPTQASREGV
jgi:hypothetical protein